jgi:hypothetical protein
MKTEVAENPIDQNEHFKLAYEFIQNTQRSLFLTGKAGSGKTTFLKHLIKHTHKNTIVCAPTGVAAINAGGVTLHSFFQLPFTPYLPDRFKSYNDLSPSIDKSGLLKNLKFNSQKKNIIEKLELLIIDEISMVRCDVLDAIDITLRHYRGKMLKPFGGLQVLFIGDLYQLPPVAKDNEWDILKPSYDSPFFYSSHVIKEMELLNIELKKIYRQKDEVFINVLNRIRNNEISDSDIEWLNDLYDPTFEPPKRESYITLTTHNNRADAINTEELSKLKGNEKNIRGMVTGTFSDKNYPAELELKIKVGAQVMFVKNDTNPLKRYYNGKIGIVKNIEKDFIEISCNEDEDTIKVTIATWDNISYRYDDEEGAVKEETIGSFKQFPLRLAWAITIHKSQGLTFNQAVIDAGASFTSGQVYVALSRCVSQKGLVLKSRLQKSAVMCDERIVEFSSRENSIESLEELLSIEKQSNSRDLVYAVFNFDSLLDNLKTEIVNCQKHKHELKEKSTEVLEYLFREMLNEKDVLMRFINQLDSLYLSLNTSNGNLLKERIKSASLYFGDHIENNFIRALSVLLQDLEVIKKATKHQKEIVILINSFRNKLSAMQNIKKLL